jgi:hypothetical protein
MHQSTVSQHTAKPMGKIAVGNRVLAEPRVALGLAAPGLRMSGFSRDAVDLAVDLPLLILIHPPR